MRLNFIVQTYRARSSKRYLLRSMQGVQEEVLNDESGTCLNQSGKKEALRVIDIIGGHGPWQFRHWAIFFLATFCTSLHLFSTLPLMTISSRCICTNETDAQQSTLRNVCNVSNCRIKEFSVSWNELNNPCLLPFSEQSEEEEFQCSNTGIAIYAKSLFVLGGIISCFVTYPLMKRFGRRSVSLMSCFLLSATSLAGVWALAPGPYLVLKFVLSMGIISVYLIAAFSLTDCVSEEFRMVYFYTGQLGWGAAHFVLPLVIWIFPNWTTFNAILTIPCFILLLILCFLPETAESYAARGLWARAHKVMRSAARCNGLPSQRVEQLSTNILLTQQSEECDTGFKCNWKNYHCLLEHILLFIVGFLSSFIYFTSIWLTDWLQRKRSSYFSLMGTTEVASALILLFFAYFIPFRRLWSLTTCLSSILLIIMFIRENYVVPKLSRSTYIIEMFFASASWTITLMHFLNQPLHSRKVRCSTLTVAIGLCIGLLGSILADLQKLLFWNRNLLLIMGVPNLIIGLFIGLIPSKYMNNF